MVSILTTTVDDQRKILPDIDDINLKNKMSQTFTDILAATSKLVNYIKPQPKGMWDYFMNLIDRYYSKNLVSFGSRGIKGDFEKYDYSDSNNWWVIYCLNSILFDNLPIEQVNFKILMICAKKVISSHFLSNFYRI